MADDTPNARHTDLAIDRGATVERIDLDEHSWVDVVRGFVRDADAVFESMLEEYEWRTSGSWRYEVYKEDPRLVAAPAEHQLPAALRQTKLHLRSAYKVSFDGPGLILYRTGADSVAFHRDRSMRYLDDTKIAIAVFGEPRPFLLRRYSTGYEDASRDIDIAPGRGDLIVMGGRNQADWMHAVPKVRHATPRISATWRWTSRQGQPDSSEGYNAPRQFGASGRVGPQRRRPRG